MIHLRKRRRIEVELEKQEERGREDECAFSYYYLKDCLEGLQFMNIFCSVEEEEDHEEHQLYS